MTESERENPDRIQHGTERMRRFFSHFGIRSAREDRKRLDDE